MKAMFSLIVLLIVLAVVGLISKKQMQAIAPVAPGASASVSTTGMPTGSPQQIEQRIKEDAERALRQGAARASDAE